MSGLLFDICHFVLEDRSAGPDQPVPATENVPECAEDIHQWIHEIHHAMDKYGNSMLIMLI